MGGGRLGAHRIEVKAEQVGVEGAGVRGGEGPAVKRGGSPQDTTFEILCCTVLLLSILIPPRSRVKFQSWEFDWPSLCHALRKVGHIGGHPLKETGDSFKDSSGFPEGRRKGGAVMGKGCEAWGEGSLGASQIKSWQVSQSRSRSRGRTA